MRDNSTLLHRLHLWAVDQPEQAALHSKNADHVWTSITAKKYWCTVVRIAEGLKQAGFKPGDRAIIYSLNSPDWVQWELGIMLAGMISVGLHPNSTDSDLDVILEQIRPNLILVEAPVFRDRLSKNEHPVPCFTFEEAKSEWLLSITDDSEKLLLLGVKKLSEINSMATQMVVFTSGSTGNPKGVMLGLKQITFVSDCLSREWNLPFMNGHLFSFLPLAHVAEKIHTLGVAITQRYPVWFNSGFDRFLEELKEVRPSLLLAVPRVWERLKEQVEAKKPRLLKRMMELERLGGFADKLYLSHAKEQMGLDRLRLAVSGAVKLAPSLAEWFLGIGIEIQEIYGMSESCGLITLTRSPRESFKTVGTIPAGIEVKITSEGEIWLRGPNVFLGYWADEESTQAVLLPEGWLKTGDLGEWKPELEIIGRNRDIIKLSNGKMIAPLPIENALKQIPEISNVCLVGEGKSDLMALITLKESVLMEVKFVPGAIEGLSVEDEKLKERIGRQINALISNKTVTDKLTKFVILSRDFKIETHELTPTQKLNRNRIQQNFKHFIDFKFEM